MKRIFLILITFCTATSCIVLHRAVRYGNADIDDHNIFYTYDLHENQNKFHFYKADSSIIDTLDINWNYKNTDFHNLDSLLKNTWTRAFLIVRNDTILFEKYYRGYTREDISTVFLFQNLLHLWLLALPLTRDIFRGNDPVTKYIPELNYADPMFKSLQLNIYWICGRELNLMRIMDLIHSQKLHLYYGANQLRLIKIKI